MGASGRRTAEVSWTEIGDLVPRIMGLGGLAYLREVRDGRLPGDPFAEMLGFRVTEADEGRIVLEVTPQPQHGNFGGMAHGGFLSTLLDSATGLALFTTLGPGGTPPHIQVAYSFLEAARIGVPLRCEGRVERAGKRVGHVRAVLHDADDRLICTGASTHAVVAHEFWQRQEAVERSTVG